MSRQPAEALFGHALEEALLVRLNGCVFRVASYNIGWNHKDKTKGFDELCLEVHSMVLDHDIHVLLLCEVFGIEDHLNEDEEIASRLVKFLNEQGKSSSAEQPAARQWAGVGCYHYVALWRTDLGFTCEDEQSFHCRIASRPWQKGQYLRFVNKDWPHEKNRCEHRVGHCV